jgi:hypothetical protein
MFMHQNNQLLLVYDERSLVSQRPATFQFEVLMTPFVELRVIAEKRRT